MIELPPSFTHEAPKGFHYSVQQHRRNMLSIWLHHPNRYVYTSDPVRTIWGFYDTKKQVYCAPINAKKHGEVVEFENTRNYTAMQLNLKGLEFFFQ
tara:strand:+ start:9485 stop:9772 length:288 start_codon:yes stop_codon:yes gene_type:complete